MAICIPDYIILRPQLGEIQTSRGKQGIHFTQSRDIYSIAELSCRLEKVDTDSNQYKLETHDASYIYQLHEMYLPALSACRAHLMMAVFLFASGPTLVA